MKYKIASNVSEEKVQDAIRGLFVYSQDGDEYHINLTENGDIRITSHNGTISISPQSMNQLIIKSDK